MTTPAHQAYVFARKWIKIQPERNARALPAQKRSRNIQKAILPGLADVW